MLDENRRLVSDEVERPSFPKRPGMFGAGSAATASSNQMHRIQRRLTAGLVVWDAFIPVALLALTAQLQDGAVTPAGRVEYPNDKLALLLAILAPLALAAAGAYESRSRRGDSRLFFGVRVLLVGVVLSWASMNIAGLAGWPVDHGQLLALAVAMPAGWLLGRAVRDRHPGLGLERVLMVGSGEVADRVIGLTRRHRERRMIVVGRVEDDASGRPFDQVPLLGAIEDLPRLVVSHGIDRVIVGFVPGRDSALVESLRSCVAAGVHVDVVPRLFDLVGTAPRSHALGGMALVAVPGRGLSGLQRAAKRALDVMGALGLLVVFAPLMLASAIAIVINDGRPVLFRQKRVGKGGREFSILKFRTMRCDSETNGVALAVALADRDERTGASDLLISSVVRELKQATEHRVFAVGGILRRSSLDELPQLFNVLRGDMSLIGPRPLRPFEVASLAPWQLARQELRPGLTGLWQVLGRSAVDWDERMQLDYSYVSHWSFGSDLRILARTVPAVLRKDGAV